MSTRRDFLERVVSGVVVPEGDGHWIEYAGGYTDMLTQRGDDIKRDTAAPAKKADAAISPAPSAEKPQARRKLSFKEKHALETLPATMAALEKKIADMPKLPARKR